jgi:hypothetical protein
VHGNTGEPLLDFNGSIDPEKVIKFDEAEVRRGLVTVFLRKVGSEK